MDENKTPTPAANTETVSAKAVKLSAAQERIIKAIATLLNTNSAGFDENGYTGLRRIRYASITTAEVLQELELLEIWHDGIGYTSIRVRLTDAGREYAIARGWLTAPANSEPQADVTPADYAAVESMGEVAANVFGSDDSMFHNGDIVRVTFNNIAPRKATVIGKETDRFGKTEYKVVDTTGQVHYRAASELSLFADTATPNVLDVPASDEISKQDAQPEGVLTDKQSEALEDIVSVAKSYVEMKGTIRRSWVGKIPRKRLIELDDLGMIDFYVDRAQQTLELTSTGIAYAKSRGWLTDAGRAAIAQTAPVDGGSDSGDANKFPIGDEIDAIFNALENLYSIGDYDHEQQARRAQKVLDGVEDKLDAQQRTIERQQAEIRTLESKLAAAAAALEAIANMQLLDGWKLIDARIKAREALAKLAAREQSGAGEG